jgi:hypothetical protein
MRDLVGPLAARLEHCLELGSGDGARVVTALGLLLLGAWQMDAGPALQGNDLPDDLVEFAQQFSPSDIFRGYAPLLLVGIRAAGG